MLAATTLLVGCTSDTKSTCVLWASYPAAQDAYDAADLVVVGTAGDVVGSVTLNGTDVPLHEFHVEQTLKGAAPADLTVAPAPVTCSPDPGVDPFTTDARVVVLLAHANGAYRALSPDAGVTELEQGDAPPFEVEG